MLGPVYLFQYATGSYTDINVELLARLSGTISCTVAPVVSLRDLGTSPTTSYISGSQIASLTTSTADGVFETNYGATSITFYGGHYYGIGFSSGTCVTAPTIDFTARY
jgi:hypothetical protein